jgi:hypothetical protein
MKTPDLLPYSGPTYTGAKERTRLFQRWGLPIFWPLEGDDQDKPTTWRGSMFTDRDGKPVALWVEKS